MLELLFLPTTEPLAVGSLARHPNDGYCRITDRVLPLSELTHLGYAQAGGYVAHHLYEVSDEPIKLGDYYIQGDSMDDNGLPYLRRTVDHTWHEAHMPRHAGFGVDYAAFFAEHGYYPYPLLSPTLQHEYGSVNLWPTHRRVTRSTNPNLGLPGFRDEEIERVLAHTAVPQPHEH